MKDLLDAFYMQGGTRDVVLYAIAIDPQQPISMDLSPVMRQSRAGSRACAFLRNCLLQSRLI